MKPPIYLLRFLLLLAAVPAAWAGSTTLTTYYPAPFGAYNTIRLSQNQAVDCTNSVNAGTLFLDIGGNIKICNNLTANSLGGAWAVVNNLLSPSPDTYNLSTVKNVGIGTTAPTNALQVKDLINFPNSISGTFLGYQAGPTAIGIGNTYVGYQTGWKSTAGSDNTAIGYQALINANASYNTAIGSSTLPSSSGFYNTAIGYQALYNNSIGSWDTAIGSMALYNNNGTATNTATGYQALYNNTSGTQNTATGLQALYSNVSGNWNTAIGDQALYTNTASSNTAIGYRALTRNSTGATNTATGYQALYGNTTGYQNTATGSNALLNNTTGATNTATGYVALMNNSTGSWNTAIGGSALGSNTTGSNNTATGYVALSANTSGYQNTATGSNALNSDISGNNNTAIGFSALRVNSGGDNNTAIGTNALYSNLTGNNNVALGYYAGKYETGSNAFYVNNVDQGTLANDKAYSLLYGTFTFSLSSIAGQKLIINGNVGVNAPAPAEMLEVNGNIKLSGASPTYKITNVLNPTAAQDVATKSYVDAAGGAGGPKGISARSPGTMSGQVYMAATYCYNLSAAAQVARDGNTTTVYTDWRLPSAQEADVFAGSIPLPNNTFWTSSLSGTTYILVDINGAATTSFSSDYARCVR